MLAGCGSDPSPGGTDAGVPDASDGGLTLAPPAIPWLDEGYPSIAPPMLTPCPDGWREATNGEGTPICQPYPEGGAAACPSGQAHFPGEAGCAPVGQPCPAGQFADGLPTDRGIVYVQPGATGGDGTVGRPLGSVSELTPAQLSTEIVVALSKGTHEGPIRMSGGLTLWGACAGETVLQSPVPDDVVCVVTLVGSGGVVRDLTVADSARPGICLESTAALGRLEGVVVRATSFLGVGAYGGRLTADTLVVEGTVGRVGTGDFGRGLEIDAGARVEVSRTVVHANHEIGVLVRGAGTSLTLTDAVVRDTRGQMRDGLSGRGIAVDQGASAAVARALVEANHDLGASVRDSGSVLTLTDTVVRDTQSRESDLLFGRGVDVDGGATAELSRVHVDGNRDLGVFAAGVGTMLTVADAIIEGTQGQERNFEFGRGMGIQGGATADVTRTHFIANHEVAVIIDMAGTRGTFSDIVIRDTRGQGNDARFGRAITMQNGGEGEWTRALLAGNRDVGVMVGGAGSAVTLTDVAIRDTLSQALDSSGGRGLSIQLGATGRITRVLLDHNRELGIFVGGADTSAMLTDVVVRDTESNERDGLGGAGLHAQLGAVVDVTRARFEANRVAGVLATDAVVSMEDVAILSTRELACAETTCLGATLGHGVACQRLGARLRLTRFAIRDSALCGVLLAEGAEVDLEHGEVSGNPIGICLQISDYDIERLTGTVAYSDNGTNLQATTFPVPDASNPADP